MTTLDVWRARDRDEDWKAGWKEGWKEDWKEGCREGAARFQRRQLTCRFGPLPSELGARLDGADYAQMEAWADVVLTASTLDGIFRVATAPPHDK